MLRTKNIVGKMDRKIQILQESTEKDEYNADSRTGWTVFKSVWASVDDYRGSEQYQGEQLTATRQTEFNIRYLSGVKEKMRVGYEGRYYDITSIQRPDRNRSLKLVASYLDDEDFFFSVGGVFDQTFDEKFN